MLLGTCLAHNLVWELTRLACFCVLCLQSNKTQGRAFWGSFVGQSVVKYDGELACIDGLSRDRSIETISVYA